MNPLRRPKTDARPILGSGMLAAQALIGSFFVLCAAHLGAGAAEACGPGVYEVRFWNEDLPDNPEAFLRGELVPLGTRFPLAYSYIAYRHLLDLPVSEAMVRALLPEPVEAGPEPGSLWLEARAKIPGEREEIFWLPRIRWIEVEHGDQIWAEGLWNCLDDAFDTARQTLETRSERFGAASAEVREWLSAQDMVFANCDEGRHIPPQLGSSWPEILRHDREYQIAAAYFYSLDFREAERRFRIIAGHDSSPWSEVARYLVARAMARDDRAAEAIAYLDGLIGDAAYSTYRNACRGLRDHLQHRIDPTQRLAELGERLARPEPAISDPVEPAGQAGKQLRQDLIDLERALGSGPAPNEIVAWLQTVEGGDPQSTEAALARFESGQGDHWWLAAAHAFLADPKAHPPTLSHRLQTASAQPSGETAEEGEEAFEAKEVGGAVHWPMAYTRLALLANSERLEKADKELAILLETAPAPSLRNRFLDLHRRLAPDLETYVERSLMQPAVSGWVDSDHRPLLQLDDPSLAEKRLLDRQAARVLNHVPASRLLALAALDSLPPELRQRLVRVAFTRAFLSRDSPSLLAAAAQMARSEPELAPEMAALSGAAEPAEQRFVAALAILRTPGLHPDVHGDLGRRTGIRELDSFGQNWWCDGANFDVDFGPLHVSPPLQALLQEGANGSALASFESAPLALGPELLEWAGAHRRDARVPEALHLLVRMTRRNCRWGSRQGFGTVSRTAFEILHRRYSDSPWTAATPYWFD